MKKKPQINFEIVTLSAEVHVHFMQFSAELHIHKKFLKLYHTRQNSKVAAAECLGEDTFVKVLKTKCAVILKKKWMCCINERKEYGNIIYFCKVPRT
jgi:hypothetical protein